MEPRALGSKFSGLCTGCENAFRRFARLYFSFTWSIQKPNRQTLFRDLMWKAGHACATCRLFHSYETHTDFQRLEITPIFVQLDPELVSFTPAIHHFSLQAGTRDLASFRVCDLGNEASPYMTRQRGPNLDWAEAKQWFHDCSGWHSKCVVSKAQALPSRLIHVGGTTQQPRLVNTTGQSLSLIHI